MVYIMHIYNKYTKKVERVLNFGKYKGRTIKEIHTYHNGYLCWCRYNIGEPFWNALTNAEKEIVLKDGHKPCKDYADELYGNTSHGRYSGVWGDGALWCGLVSDADQY